MGVNGRQDSENEMGGTLSFVFFVLTQLTGFRKAANAQDINVTVSLLITETKEMISQ